MPGSEPQFPIEEIRDTVYELHEELPVVTTRDVAAVVGCHRETARVKLNRLTAEGVLVARKVGARAKIWYAPDLVYQVPPENLGTETDNVRSHSKRKSTTNQSNNSGDTFAMNQPKRDAISTVTTETVPDEGEAPVDQSATSQSTDENVEEQVLFFPGRREIVLHSPTASSQRILAQTAHLVDSTGNGYLYKIDQTDIWNAPYDTFESLRNNLITLVGDNWDGGFESRIKDDWNRAHQFRLRTHDDGYTVLEAQDADVFENVAKRKLTYGDHYTKFLSDTELRVTAGNDAEVKETLYDAGYPAIDERRLEEGSSLVVKVENNIQLRDYQQEWVNQFTERHSGVFVGPSGSGKTIASLGVMEAIGGETLIIVPNRELAQQWKDELLEKTNLSYHKIGQYHGGTKQIRPVTIATYDTAAMSRHRELFNERDWGLVIADECHHSVASTWKRFRGIQSKARLGLSATPVREADDPKEIYTLIGPPIGTDWGTLFAEGWVEKPDVAIVTIPWGNQNARERYQRATGSKRLIEAARNPKKTDVVDRILDQHSDQKALIFVDWIKQGNQLADELGLPFIYGETDHSVREDLYQQFRNGEIKVLIISRVGDEGIDLPDAEVAVLASTMGSSRSQTGQRAGRTMRPLGDAQVYILLTKGSGEEDWGRESTQYLAEKGINITRMDWNKI